MSSARNRTTQHSQAGGASVESILKPNIKEESLQTEPLHEILIDDQVVSDLKFERACFESIDAAHVSLQHMLFDACSFVNVVLHNLDLTDAKLVNCNLANIDWASSVMHRTQFIGCNLTGVDLRGATLRNVIFQQCVIRYSFFREASLKQTAFIGCRMEYADFQQTKLSGKTFFQQSNLTRAQMSGTALREIDLSDCIIDGIGVRAEDLAGAIVSPAQAVELAKLLGIIVKA